MLKTMPTSPLFVRKISSSTKPKRFTCVHSAAASSYSFVICASLNTVQPPHLDRLKFHWVVLRANLCGVQQKPENLRVGPCCPPREQIKREKYPYGPGQTIQQIEYARAHYQREEEQFSLRSQNGERAIERPEYRVGVHLRCPGTA